MDWATIVVEAIAAAATVGGFFLAIRELRRAARANEETARNVREVRLLGVLQEMRETERLLDGSVRDTDRAGAERAARDWRNLASDAHGLLSRREPVNQELMQVLLDSIEVATRTKSELVTEAGSIAEVTAKLSEIVGAVCNGVGLIGSSITAVRIERNA